MEQDDPVTFLGYERDASILHEDLDWLVHALEVAVVGIDVFACLILVIGGLRFIVGFALAKISRNTAIRVRGVNSERVNLGRYILAGLELLIVSDIIHTALSLAMIDLLFLGLLVVIRSVISYFIDMELEQVKKELRE